MSVSRILGGTIAFIGSFFIILYAIFQIYSIECIKPMVCAPLILNFIIGFVALIGCFLGFASKKAGGILLLLIGLVSIILGLLSFFSPEMQNYFLQYSWLWLHLNFNYLISFIGITLEAILITFGGLLLLKSQ